MSKVPLLFVSFAKDYWDGIVMSRHQVMKRLALDHKVLFVSPRYNLADVVGGIGRRRLLPCGPRRVSQNLTALIPPKRFPKVFASQFLDKISLLLFSRYLGGIIRKIQYDRLVIYLWNPRFFEFIGKLNEDMVCYHVHDQFRGYATTSDDEAMALDDAEDYVLRHSDLVFANGRKLRNAKNKYGNAYNVPSAVDFRHYQRVYNNDCPEPVQMMKVPKPRIGLVGRITRKVDLRLIYMLAQSMRNYSFVVLGPVRRDESIVGSFNDLLGLRNFYYIGEQDAEKLPYFIKCLDVCLMPYVVNEHTLFIYPLKLHEYLAMGKAVVASNLPCLTEFEGVVRIASSFGQWIANIEMALREEAEPCLVNERIRIASQNSWEDRVETIETLIYDKLGLKHHEGAPSER